MTRKGVRFLTKKDFDAKPLIPILKEQSIKNIWNGDKFSELRDTHLKNNRNQVYPCDGCPVGA
jgi:hypothetical protein